MKSIENVIKEVNNARRAEKQNLGWQWSGLYDGKYAFFRGRGTLVIHAVVKRPGGLFVNDKSPKNLSVKGFKQWVSDFVSKEPGDKR